MAWTSPKTWALEEIPAYTDFNTQFRDNFNWFMTSTGGLYNTPAAVQSLTANGQTITLPATGWMKEITATGAYTGIILAAGSTDGQVLGLFNSSGNSPVFAASGTSNVAAGTGAAIVALRLMLCVWDSGSSLWYIVN